MKTSAPAMGRLQAERLAERLNRECPDKVRWSFVPKHSAIEGAWTVQKLDCLDRERVHSVIYQDVEGVG